MHKAFKRFLQAATIVLAAMTVATQAGSYASHTEVQAAPAPPFDDEIDPDFCDAAREAARACWIEYENCGGVDVDGCYDTLDQCLMDSGIWQCE